MCLVLCQLSRFKLTANANAIPILTSQVRINRIICNSQTKCDKVNFRMSIRRKYELGFTCQVGTRTALSFVRQYEFMYFLFIPMKKKRFILPAEQSLQNSHVTSKFDSPFAGSMNQALSWSKTGSSFTGC